MDFDFLMHEFEKLNRDAKPLDRSYLEICGFPHYETVISNILAFFFDYGASHALGGLLAKSLYDSGSLDTDGLDLNFEVERELCTNNGKFIDLVLIGADTVIVIENKIFAPLYNDLEDYFNFVAQEYPPTKDKTIHGFVLSMREVEISNPNFKNITYKNFVRFIRNNLGQFLGSNANQHLFFLLDLLKNIESLYEGKSNMNMNFVNLIKKDPEAILKFGAELKKYHDQLRKLVASVNTIVTDELMNEGIPGLKQWAYRELPELFDIAVSDFLISNGAQLAINSMVDYEKWEFQIFVRKYNGIDLDIDDYMKIKGLAGKMVDERFVLDETLPLDANPEVVARKVSGIIKALCR